ncbi:MAG: hypothetical protein A3F40_05170 [Chlamydiae bacterium RIFCSPHIGHO2_12_FULL_27_8]|nr:MAG: hypothetical protein A3F40_05170 [Chlamydiae bacterium RIFCSPHIGHO2_12_FULL_27_8]
MFLPLKKSQDLIKATTILSLFKFSQILYNDYGLSKGLGNISALILSSFIGTYSSDKLTKKALNKTALKSVNNFSEFFSYFGAFIGIKGNLVFYKFLDSTTITLTTIGVGYCLNKDS